MWKSIELWLLLIATFVSWAAWGLVLTKVSPIESPHLAVPMFYVTGFLALLTTFSVIGSLLRKFSTPGKKMLRCINISLRQGTILAGICTLAVFFQQVNTFSWWIAILLIVIAVVLETLFWTSDS